MHEFGCLQFALNALPSKVFLACISKEPCLHRDRRTQKQCCCLFGARPHQEPFPMSRVRPRVGQSQTKLPRHCGLHQKPVWLPCGEQALAIGTVNTMFFEFCDVVRNIVNRSASPSTPNSSRRTARSRSARRRGWRMQICRCIHCIEVGLSFFRMNRRCGWLSVGACIPMPR